MESNLIPLLCPRSVAVIGASRKPKTIAGEVFRNLIQQGFTGPVYPVNPASDSVHGVHAYARVSDIPGPVDLAVMVVPRPSVARAVDDCIAKGVRAIVIISAGFGETGPAGKAEQDEIVRKCRAHGVRLVGPNCLGILNTDPRVALNATFAPTWPPCGNVAFASQSGALGLAVLDYARELGIGVSSFVSMGNKADVSSNDLVEYWGADERTHVVLLYIESFGNARRFREIASRVGLKKPIIAVKSGRTATGASAAGSHTGALAGSEAAVTALFKQAGIIRADTIHDLFDVAVLLDQQPVPAGHRVALVTNAGGLGIMAADACESRGLELPPLTPEVIAELAPLLPEAASVKNPVDMLASAPAASYERVVNRLLAEPTIDAVIALFTPAPVTPALEVGEALARVGERSTKPLLAVIVGTYGVEPAVQALRRGRIPTYRFPEAAATALAHAASYGTWRKRRAALPPPAAVPASPAPTTTSAPRWLSPMDVDALLRAHGVRAIPVRLAATLAEAARAASALGYPVAVKLASETITHKTEVSGVELNLADEGEVAAAFARIAGQLAARGLSEAMQGVVVQPMARPGVEMFVGMTRDSTFGPLVAVGTGGTAVELWRDVSFRLAPLDRTDVEEMLLELRGAKLLQGFRGAAPKDREAFIELVLAVGRLALACPEVVSLDLNPVLVHDAGQGAQALDARISVVRS